MKKLLFLFYFILIAPLFGIELNENFLNQFEGVALKTIRKSETHLANYKQSKREFNGIRDFKHILGNDKKTFNTKFIYIDDNLYDEINIKTTWYNYKNKKTNKKLYSLYYQKNPISEKYIRENDLMLLGKINNDNLIILIINSNSKYKNKLLSIFEDSNNHTINEISDFKKENNVEKQAIPQPTIQEQAQPISTDTSNLIEYPELKIYKNAKTQKIVVLGKVTKIKDGDTIVISDLFNVRMLGIDAPESKQICKDKNGKEYRCGEKATEYLKKIVGRQNLTCVNNGNEKYGRFLFVCKTEKYDDINREMVRNGWALSYYDDLYKEDEKYAKENKLGIWEGTFQIPSEWRKQNKGKK